MDVTSGAPCWWEAVADRRSGGNREPRHLLLIRQMLAAWDPSSGEFRISRHRDRSSSGRSHYALRVTPSDSAVPAHARPTATNARRRALASRLIVNWSTRGPLVKRFVYLSATLTLSIAIAFVAGGTFPSLQNAAVTNVALAIVAAILFLGIEAAWGFRQRIRLWFKLVRMGDEMVRLSISYLLHIESSGKYLLIRGTRYPGQFQPVGGVYKRAASSMSYLHSLGVQDDNLVPIDATSRLDLRVRVPARNVMRVLQWFESGRGRELSPEREFYEEMLKTGLASSSAFPFLNYEYSHRFDRPLTFSAWAQCKEIIVADIFTVHLDANQEAAIAAAVSQNPNELVWATKNEIERRGAVPGQSQTVNIAVTADWLFDRGA